MFILPTHFLSFPTIFFMASIDYFSVFSSGVEAVEQAAHTTLTYYHLIVPAVNLLTDYLHVYTSSRYRATLAFI